MRARVGEAGEVSLYVLVALVEFWDIAFCLGIVAWGNAIGRAPSFLFRFNS
jgi:hypothetical protein